MAQSARPKKEKYPTAKSLGVDLSIASLYQLDSLISEAQEAIKAIRIKERRQAENAIMKLAKGSGIDLASLTELPLATTPAKQSRPPKYVNPVNEKDTWTGLGRKPEWLVTYLENGGLLDRLLIKTKA
ncbi:H-NS histone family protein [Neisseriaceae bacterium JH1-16]|nr:H-NS histone family protein [Neisseriaceae bacterium JH1-16]